MAIKRAATIDALQRELQTVSSCLSGETRFGAQALLFIAEKVDTLVKLRQGTLTAKPAEPAKPAKPAKPLQSKIVAPEPPPAEPPPAERKTEESDETQEAS